MKKIKLKIVLKIKKILENQLTKMNKISHNIQSDILLENAEKQKQIFFEKIDEALRNNWCCRHEANYWLDLIVEAKNGNEDSLILLRAEFKFNDAFKKETGAFKNV
jgi:hypothetical protein